MRTKKFSLSAGAIILVLSVLVLSSQGTVSACWSTGAAGSFPTDPDFPVQDWRDPMASNEMHADVAYNPDEDEYLVVFDWDWDGSDGHDVMFTTVYSNGGTAPMPLDVASSTDFDDAYPAVAYNPDAGNYLAAWQRRQDTGDYQIFGSIITDTAGSPFPITVSGGDQVYADVAYATGPQRYLVVWEDHAIGFSPPPDIRGASIDGGGAGIQILHISGYSTSGEQTYPAVAINDATGRGLVTWQDSRNSGTTGDDIYGQQVYFPAGGPLLWGSQIHIGTLSGQAGAPAVAWGQVGAAGGEFLAVWAEDNVVYARRIQADNTPTGGPITVSDFSSGKSHPAVAHATGSNDWWVVWEDNRDYG
jgi:hypothetical protein